MSNQSLLRDDIEYAVQCDDHGKIIGPVSKTHAHLLSYQVTKDALEAYLKK